MKKITFISFLLCIFTISAFSQNEKFFRFGIHGSPSLAWMKPTKKDIQSDGLRLGFGYGLITEFTLGDNYSLATGIESSYSGGKLLQNNLADTSVITTLYKIQYLEIPITLKMKTNEINYITYFAKFGGGINARLQASKDETIKKGQTTITNEDVDILNKVSFFRVAFHVGLGIEYSLGGSTALLVGLNFNNGLIDILKGDALNAKNNFINMNIGVLF